MTDPGLLGLFLVGLLGAGHCAAMCGGIVGAFASARGYGTDRAWSLHLAYNLGRITSYAAAGAIAGALGSVALVFADMAAIRLGLLVFANLMLVALGAYLIGYTRTLASFERVGQSLWRRIQPLTGRFLPVRSTREAFPLGLLWGWLPCGLVYSSLATAVAAGSGTRGALVMLAFGLGTLPNLMLAGLLADRFRVAARTPAVRVAAGLVVAGLGVWGLRGAWILATRWQSP